MDITLFLSFVVVSTGLIAIPGPNVLVIVSTSLAHGKTRGLQTVAGTTTAMAIQMTIAAVGTAWFVQWITQGFFILKWIGIVYLLYLAWAHFRQFRITDGSNVPASASGTFTKGFLVSLTNPKTILFFTAFLPQFVSAQGDYSQQITLLSITFLALAATLDSCYALLSARLYPMLQRRQYAQLQNGLSGLLYLSASVWLATLRRAP